MRNGNGTQGLENTAEKLKTSDSNSQSQLNFPDIMSDNPMGYLTPKSIMAQQTQGHVDRGWLGRVTLVDETSKSVSISSANGKRIERGNVHTNPRDAWAKGDTKSPLSSSMQSADSKKGNPLRTKSGKKRKGRSELVKSLLKDRFEEELRHVSAEKLTRLVENALEDEGEQRIDQHDETVEETLDLRQKIKAAIEELRAATDNEAEEIDESEKSDEPQGLVSVNVLITNAQQGRPSGRAQSGTAQAGAAHTGSAPATVVQSI
jgi:hypothetical protein